jgi:hypothetical protein
MLKLTTQYDGMLCIAVVTIMAVPSTRLSRRESTRCSNFGKLKYRKDNLRRQKQPIC